MKRTMYYVMSLTWGLPLNICGVVVALFLLATGHRPRRWGGCLCFEVGKTRWGGLESRAGDLVPARGGRITVKMGKLTDLEEAYEIMLGGM